MQDTENVKKVIPFAIILLVGSLSLLIVAALVTNMHPAQATPITPTPSPIINITVTPTPTPIVNITVTPIPTVLPVQNNTTNSVVPAYAGKNYDDYVLWVTEYYYKPNVTEPWTAGYVDPLSPDGYAEYELWMKENPAPSVKPFDGTNYGVSIYGSPTPTPTPTPTPIPWDAGMVHQYRAVNLIDLGFDAEQNGYLTLIPQSSNDTGVFLYYSVGDMPVFHLKFSCRNPVTYVNPVVQIDINKVDDYGHEVPGWTFNKTLNSTIPKASYTYDGDLTEASTWTLTADPGFLIPPYFTDDAGNKEYTNGMYIIHITIWTPNKDLILDKISHETTILADKMI